MKELALIFGRLGFLGFGGPIATMGMMEEEISRKRGWVSPEKFAEIYAVCKVMPGPVASQMAIYLGFLRAGRWGGFLAGTLFILPSFLMVLTFSIFYGRIANLGPAAKILGGMQIGALAVILFSTLNLARPFRTQPRAWLIGLICATTVYLNSGVEPWLVLGFGILGVLSTLKPQARALTLPALGACYGLSIVDWPKLAQLAWICFKAGAFVFGTGLAIVPVLESEVVSLHHWLTHAQFMDGLAIGQVTPGPVVITATFLGYQVSGFIGAIVATACVFLPGFINMLWLVPKIWNRISGTPAARAFTQWAIPAVIGGIATTTFKLGLITLQGTAALIIFVLAVLGGLFFKIPGWTLIPVSGLGAYLVTLL